MNALFETSWAAVLTLVTGTFASEDATCATAGILTRDWRISTSLAVAGCWLGIFIGDLGLWAVGRYFGKPIWESRWR